MSMSNRFWAYTVILVAALVLWFAQWTTHAAAPALRSEHSEPAVAMPAKQVAVTAAGKQFHAPTCRFIHGKVEMMSAEEAAAKGYTPDPRCMKEALAKK